MDGKNREPVQINGGRYWSHVLKLKVTETNDTLIRMENL